MMTTGAFSSESTIPQSAPCIVLHLLFYCSQLHSCSGPEVCFPQTAFPSKSCTCFLFFLSGLSKSVSSVTGPCAEYLRSFYCRLSRIAPVHSLDKSHGPPTFQISCLIPTPSALPTSTYECSMNVLVCCVSPSRFLFLCPFFLLNAPP